MIYEANKQPKRIGELLNLSRFENGGRAPKNLDAKAPESRKGANSERASLIGFFTDTLNLTRDGKKYKKLSYSRIGALLSHLSVRDLYYLKRYCEEAKNFSSCFWWSINPKKHQ